MNWDQIVNKITPHIVKIETQTKYGTGFLSLYNENKTLCGVATALHVVNHADDWQQPIRIQHHASGETVFLEQNNRAGISQIYQGGSNNQEITGIAR